MAWKIALIMRAPTCSTIGERLPKGVGEGHVPSRSDREATRASPTIIRARSLAIIMRTV